MHQTLMKTTVARSVHTVDSIPIPIPSNNAVLQSYRLQTCNGLKRHIVRIHLLPGRRSLPLSLHYYYYCCCTNTLLRWQAAAAQPNMWLLQRCLPLMTRLLLVQLLLVVLLMQLLLLRGLVAAILVVTRCWSQLR